MNKDGAMNKDSLRNEIWDFLQGKSTPGFSGRKVFPPGKKHDELKTLDELFTIDGLPVFWFYRRYLSPYVLPRLVNTYAALEKGEKLSLGRRACLQLSSQALRKYIFFNEGRKIKKTEKITKIAKISSPLSSSIFPPTGSPPSRKALFLTYFSHRGSDSRLYRIQGMVDLFQGDKRLEPFPVFITPLTSSLPDQHHHQYRQNDRLDIDSAHYTGLSTNHRRLTTIYQYAEETTFQAAKQKAKIFSKRWKNIDVSALDAALTVDISPDNLTVDLNREHISPENISLKHTSLQHRSLENTGRGRKRQLWPYLRYAFSLFMSPEFLSIIFWYYEMSKNLIEKENVAVVFLSGQTGLLERCLAAAARTKGIPCLLVPHGYTFKNIPARDILDNMYLPVFNRTTQQAFLASGVPSTQIRVTGPAAYDAIVNYKLRRLEREKEREGKERERKKKDKNKKDQDKKDKSKKDRKGASLEGKFSSKNTSRNILLLTQPLVEDNLITEEGFFTLVETILTEILTINGVHIAIKLHPRERGLPRYQEIVKRLETEQQEKNRGPTTVNSVPTTNSVPQPAISVYQQGEADLLYGLLEQADVVLNFYATAGILEASILDIPSITFPFDGQKNNKYGDFDPSLYVLEIKSLKPAMEKLLDNPALLREKRQKMVQEFCSVVDGKASRRIVQWTYELLGMETSCSKSTLAKAKSISSSMSTARSRGIMKA